MNHSPNLVQADNDLSISFSPDRWTLISTELEQPTTLMDVTPENLIAHPFFVQVRDLPTATLSPAQVARVVLGWAHEKEAWELGLLLIDGSRSKLDTTQMRWCKLAAWHSHEATAGNGARRAAQSLARLINRPFQLVEPYTDTRVPAFASPAQSDRPAPEAAEASPEQDETQTDDPAVDYPTVALRPLPLAMDEWRLVLTADGLKWEQRRAWWLSHIGRISLYAVLCGLFLLLGIGTRTSGLAPVQPDWLPTVGLGIALILFLNMLLVMARMLRAGSVVINTFKREVYQQGTLLPIIKWRVPFEEIDYLVLSQTPARPQGRPQRDAPMNIAQDIWLHVARNNDQFYEIVALDNVEGRSHAWATVRNHAQYPLRRRLLLAEYDTPAHHAALHIGERLDVPIYLDVR